MKIRDIVNRDIVNLTNCEQEPIHIPGSIQPHGFLLGLNDQSFIIEYCSGNVEEYIKIVPSELLERSFPDVFGEDNLQLLTEYMSGGHMLSSVLLQINLRENEYLCTVHNSKGIIILEAEPLGDDRKKTSDIYNQTSQFLSYMHDTHTLKELCQLVAHGTREITGYDRVMVYRFDKDYNG